MMPFPPSSVQTTDMSDLITYEITIIMSPREQSLLFASESLYAEQKADLNSFP